MTITPTTHEVRLPAGAVSADDWEVITRADGSPELSRCFMGSSWRVNRSYDGADIEIALGGYQYANDDASRYVFTDVSSGPLTLAEARQLADALRAAVDEGEQMNGYDRIEVSR